MPQRLANKVLLIGWDAADWRVINPLMDAGQMPTLNRLVNEGVIANLATLDPPLSPMLWTSIATGKTADQHGVLGFTEPTPDGQGLRPVQSTTRKAKAVWNILNQEGLRSNVVGWWPSHPAEPINGAAVSNFFHQANVPYGEPWPPAPGAVHPPELAEILAAQRVHPQELTGAHLLPFVPLAEEIDQEKDRRLFSVAKILADAASVHGAATWLMEHTDWDFMAVYYDAIDHFGHGFMKYHPPRRGGIDEDSYRLYKDVVIAGYRFHDMMLERLLQLAGEDTTVLLISDHGFHPDHLRPSAIPHEPAGPAVEHREHGILCLRGPHVRQDERVYGATLLDVAPTVLTLFGLPVGRDMRGKPLVQAFAGEVTPAFIDSWEDVAGETGMHPPGTGGDPEAERAALQQLVALGYIEPPGEDRQEAVARTVRESRFYLARVLLDQHRHTDALPILEAIYAEAPDQLRYGVRLAQCYHELGRFAAMRRVTEAVSAAYQQKRAARIEKLREEAGKAEQEGEAAKAAALRERAEALADRPFAGLDVLQGTLLLAEGEEDEALLHLRRAEEIDPRFPRLHLRIGDVYTKQKRWADAERAYLKALTIDPDSAAGHHGLALAYLRQQRWEEAAEAALRAVGLRFFFPAAHFHLGQALERLGYNRRAAEAYEVCVTQAPGTRRAHLRLADLYRLHLGDPARGQQHLLFATERIVAADA